MSIPEVEHLYETQVQEFKARYTAMRDKMIQMYHDHEGFRDAFKEVWENAMSIDDRRAMMKIVMQKVDDNLPPPKHKATMLLGKSCPEFFHDELTLGKTITMVDFLDFIVEKKENSTTYPFYEKIKVDLKTFLSALPTSVYPQFSRHPKEAQYTWTLLWEQRVFWVCHFALNMVAEMCAQISQFTEEEEEEVKEEDKPQKIQELKDAGNKLFYQKKYKPAMTKYKLALALDETNHVLFSNISGCHLCLGQYEEALVEAEKCLELAKEWPRGYYRKAIAELRLGRFDECEESLKSGFEFAPEDKKLKEVQNKLADAKKKEEEEKEE